MGNAMQCDAMRCNAMHVNARDFLNDSAAGYRRLPKVAPECSLSGLQMRIPRLRDSLTRHLSLIRSDLRRLWVDHSDQSFCCHCHHLSKRPLKSSCEALLLSLRHPGPSSRDALHLQFPPSESLEVRHLSQRITRISCKGNAKIAKALKRLFILKPPRNLK